MNKILPLKNWTVFAFLFFIFLFSCKEKEKACQLNSDPESDCFNGSKNSDKWYYCYRPKYYALKTTIVSSEGGANREIEANVSAFKRYTLDCPVKKRLSRDWKELECDCMVPVMNVYAKNPDGTVDFKNTEVKVIPGWHPEDKGYGVFKATNNSQQPYLVPVSWLSSLKSFINVSKFNERAWSAASEAWSDPVYAGKKVSDFDDACYSSCEGAEFSEYTCKPVQVPFEYQMLQKIKPAVTYTNGYLQPLLQADASMKDNSDQSDYFLSISQDISANDKDENVRYVYIKLALTANNAGYPKTRLILYEPDKREQIVTFDGNSNDQDNKIVYCVGSVRVVKFKLRYPGEHKLFLVNLQEPKTEYPNYGILEESSFNVGIEDKFVDPVTNEETSGTERKLSIRFIDVPGMSSYKQMYLGMTTNGNGGITTTALSNAYSLNPKKDLNNPLAVPTEVDFKFDVDGFMYGGKEIQFNGNSRDRGNLFDAEGNLRISALTYAKLYYDLSKTYSGDVSKKTAVVYAIFEMYKLMIKEFIITDKDKNYNKILAFYAKGIKFYEGYDLKTASGNSYTIRVNTTDVNVSLPDPNVYLPFGLTGPEGPSIFGFMEEKDPFILNLSVCGVFDYYITKTYGETGISLDYTKRQSAAIAILAHEIAHSWAQPQIIDHTTDDGLAGHNNLCAGYNKDVCIFKSPGTKVNFDLYHNSKNIVWCESHLQILMNQLVRKNKPDKGK
jgi:hypothetical protein